MKRIIKKDIEPIVLSSWKTTHPRKVYNDFRKYPQKRTLHSELLYEQYYLCCYCGTQIDIDCSHIEHIAPQSQFKKRTLSYPNLLISCNGDNLIESEDEEIEYCGHRKKSTYDPNMLSPLDEDCEERLMLGLGGKLSPTTEGDYGANKAIEILGLNNYVLFKARESILDSIILNELMKLSLDEQREYCETEIKYLETVDEEGRLPSFSNELVSLIKGLFDIH